MTLTTVSAPRGFANTSSFPRNGSSLNRMGALDSSLDANSKGAQERRKGAAPREKANSSRVGAAGFAVRRNLPLFAELFAEDGAVCFAIFSGNESAFRF